MIWLIVFFCSQDLDKHESRVLAATVKIVDHTGTGRVGSGVIIGSNKESSFILTCDHLIHSLSNLEVKYISGGSTKEVKILKQDSKSDLAVLMVPLVEITPVEVPPDCTIIMESDVFSCGYNEGRILSCEIFKLKGKIIENGRVFWSTDGPKTRGRSGGPLVDKNGFVIGICSGGIGDVALFSSVVEIYSILRECGFKVK